MLIIRRPGNIFSGVRFPMREKLIEITVGVLDGVSFVFTNFVGNGFSASIARG
jgi:hypothetical protein